MKLDAISSTYMYMHISRPIPCHFMNANAFNPMSLQHNGLNSRMNVSTSAHLLKQFIVVQSKVAHMPHQVVHTMEGKAIQWRGRIV